MMASPFLLSLSMWGLVAVGFWEGAARCRQEGIVGDLRKVSSWWKILVWSFRNLFRQHALVFFLLLLLVPASSFFWSDDHAYWLDRTVKRLPFLVLPWVFTAYGTFLMRQFFITIPKELEEAALIDGASRLEILRRIFIPASVPALATQATFTFLYAWNSFLWPLIVINTANEKNHVLTLALSILRGRATDAPNLILAGAAISVLPPLIVFLLAQRFYIESVTSSGVKG